MEASPTIGAYFDAAVPFRAETARSYVEGTQQKYEAALRNAKGLKPPAKALNFDPRTLYNQSFESIYAMVPGDLMLLLMLIPSMLTALSVVREKELGSIANFYAAPATQGGIPAGQAASLRRRLPHPVRNAGRACRSSVPRPDQGQPRDARARRRDLRAGKHRFRPSDLGLRRDPDGGDLRGGDHHDPARRAVLRNVRARLLADRRRVVRGKDISRAPISRRSAWAPSPRRWGSRHCGPTSSALAIIAIVYFCVSVMLLTKQEA